MLTFVFDRTENIVGKGENAGYQHFRLFPQCFQKASFSGSVKVGIMWKRVKEWAKSSLYEADLILMTTFNITGWLEDHGCPE